MSMDQVTVEINGPEGLAVMTLTGDFNAGYPIAQLNAGLREIEDAGVTRLILSAGDVGLTVSTVIGMVIRVHSELQEAGGKLIVVPSNFFRQVLETAALDQILAIADDLPAAQALMNS